MDGGHQFTKEFRFVRIRIGRRPSRQQNRCDGQETLLERSATLCANRASWSCARLLPSQPKPDPLQMPGDSPGQAFVDGPILLVECAALVSELLSGERSRLHEITPSLNRN